MFNELETGQLFYKCSKSVVSIFNFFLNLRFYLV